MSTTTQPPKRIAVTFHPNLPEAAAEARRLAAALSKQPLDGLVCTSLYDEQLLDSLQQGQYDVLIALGGDGTMLRAGRMCAPLGVPVLGINAGHFGFLTEVSQDGWQSMIEPLLAGRYRLENRMMLRVELWRAEQRIDAWDVLNEVVVCRGQFVRPIHIRASVDGYLMASYAADGLIAATPTGSTAYALAVGGPIMPPELRNILIIPIAPHLSVDRGILLSEGVRVTMDVETSHEAVLSVDGHAPVVVLNEDVVHAFAGDYTAAFIRFQDPSYFYRNLTAYMEQNPATK